MSVDKYSKHQKSRKAPIVLTTPDGDELSFNSQEEYMQSIYRQAILLEKAKKVAASKVE